MSEKKSSLRRYAMVALGIAIMVGLVFIGGEGAFDAVAQANLGYIVAALLLSALFYPLASWRWGMLTDAVAGRTVATKWEYLRVRVLSGASGFFMPREVAEIGGRTIWLNRARRVPLSQAAQAVLLDRICDLLISMVSLVSAALYLFDLVSANVAFSIMIVSVFVVALVFPTALRLVVTAGRRPLAWLMSIAQRLPFVGRKLGQLPPMETISDGVWRGAMLLSAVKFVFVVVRVLLLALAVGIALPGAEMMILVPLGQLAYLIAVTPGGLGIYEVGWFGILAAHGVDVSIVSAFVLVLRGCLILSIGMMVPLVMFVRRSETSTMPIDGVALEGSHAKSD